MRNIKRAARFDPVVKQLCEVQGSEVSRTVFKTYRDLYVMAALLGYQLARKGEINGPYVELDSRPFVSDDPTLEAMLSLALAESSDRTILLPARDDDVLELFEAYLHGGLEVLSEWCAARPTDDWGVDAIISGMVDAGLVKRTGGDGAGGVAF